MFISIRLNLIRFDLICVELIVAVFFFFILLFEFIFDILNWRTKKNRIRIRIISDSFNLFILFVCRLIFIIFGYLFFLFLVIQQSFYFYFSLNLIRHCCSANWCLLFFSSSYSSDRIDQFCECSLQARNLKKNFTFSLFEYHFQLTVFRFFDLATRLRQWHDHSVCVWESERESDECKWKEKVRIKIHH